MKAARTRFVFVLPVVLVIACVTLASLLIVRGRLERQIHHDLSGALVRSLEAFKRAEAQRLITLSRENALLADLPSLKALMTTDDERTVDDASGEFAAVSGNDLFALANRDGRVVAVRFGRVASQEGQAKSDIAAAFAKPNEHYLLTAGRLFTYSVQPIYFGSAERGTLLGYVLSGDTVDEAYVRELSRISAVDAVYATQDGIIASTIRSLAQAALRTERQKSAEAAPITIGGEHFLAVEQQLAAVPRKQLRLTVLKSTEQGRAEIRDVNEWMLAAGGLAVLAGSLLMVLVSGYVTRPIEQLAASVRDYGAGRPVGMLPANGTREVREFSAAFAAMRSDIERAKSDLLEAERLATIGKMASSVSHDLRHYLAAIYANAEFLSTSSLLPQERSEILSEIRSAVLGTTDLLESLLMFSITGNAVRRSRASVADILERSVAVVRAHPDTAGVVWETDYGQPGTTEAMVDERLLERAFYNLLLNACQSRSVGEACHRVTATLSCDESSILLTVRDSGAGVPESIRGILFDPFVSFGKQKGTGLGLTLVATAAVEHGGSVTLVSSEPGKTIFRLTLPRCCSTSDAEPSQLDGVTIATNPSRQE